MNKIKTHISIMITIVLTVSLLVCLPVCAADSESDIALTLAKGLELIGDEYAPEAEVTVGELAEVVNKLSDGTNLDRNYFEEYRYSKTASFAETVEIFLDLTGHRKLVEYKYGTINNKGVLLQAADCDLLDNIDTKGKTVLTQGDMVQLAYNLMYVNVVDTIYHGNEEIELEIGNVSYMEAALDMYELTGIVEKTSYSSINSVDGTNDDYIVINNAKYIAEKGKYEDFVGCEVTAFIKDNGSRQAVIALYNTSDSLIINAVDIYSASKSLISYYNASGRRTNIRLDASADVLYNYSLYDNYTADDLKIDFGRLVLIDNDSDRKYDVVKIEEYDSMYIFSASSESEMFMDKYGSGISLSYLIENDIPIDVKGNLVPASALGTEQMGTFFVDKSGNLTKLFVTDTVEVSGIISSIDPKYNEVYIGDIVYRYNNRIKSRLEAMEDGHTVTVLLDKFGTIAEIELSRDKYSWGYVLGFTEGTGMGNPLLKIYTEDAKFEVFELASKVKFNGETVNASEVIEYNLDSGFWDEIGKKTTIVKYRANSKNQITSLLTPTLTDPGTSGRPYNSEDGLFMYLKNSGNITPRIRLSDETIVFLIPQDMSFEHRFAVGTKTLLSNATEYTTKLYNIDENYYPEVMVARIDNYPWGQVDEWSWNAKIVESVSKVINDRGEESRVIYTRNISDGAKDRLVFNNPEHTSVFGSYIFTPKDIQVGDIVQFAVDAADTAEITDFVVRYTQKGTTPYEHVVGNSWRTSASLNRFYSEGGTFAVGRVVEVIKDGIVINNRPDGDPAWNRTCSYNNATPVWIFEKGIGKLKKASVSDIVAGDEVYNGHSGGKLQGIVIYRD